MKNEWKTRMFANNNKGDIKWLFNKSINIKMSDEECGLRVSYIINKMSEAGYETKCWYRDLLEFKKKELNGGKFDDADYIAWKTENTEVDLANEDGSDGVVADAAFVVENK